MIKTLIPVGDDLGSLSIDRSSMSLVLIVRRRCGHVGRKGSVHRTDSG